MSDSDTLKDWHELLPLAREIYAKSGAGCCWHIAMDDGNVGDDDVEFCVKYAERNEGCRTPKACHELGPMMRRASRTQRTKLYDSGEKRK